MGPEFFSLSTILLTEVNNKMDCDDQYFLVSLVAGLQDEENS